MRVICFDLDDTLYKEIDYLKSAYIEIASCAADMCTGTSFLPKVLAVKAYEAMLAAWQGGKNAFDELNAYLGLSVPGSVYLSLYRNHRPLLELDACTFDALKRLRMNGWTIGLITDGRSVQQRHKIESLNLNCFVDEDDIVISQEFGSEKPASANYEYFMKRYPNAAEYVYVGDNVDKDFIAPNQLGWTTVCLKDDGRNIHRQDFESASADALPMRVIDSLEEL